MSSIYEMNEKEKTKDQLVEKIIEQGIIEQGTVLCLMVIFQEWREKGDRLLLLPLTSVLTLIIIKAESRRVRSKKYEEVGRFKNVYPTDDKL